MDIVSSSRTAAHNEIPKEDEKPTTKGKGLKRKLVSCGSEQNPIDLTEDRTEDRHQPKPKKKKQKDPEDKSKKLEKKLGKKSQKSTVSREEFNELKEVVNRFEKAVSKLCEDTRGTVRDTSKVDINELAPELRKIESSLGMMDDRLEKIENKLGKLEKIEGFYDNLKTIFSNVQIPNGISKLTHVENNSNFMDHALKSSSTQVENSGSLNSNQEPDLEIITDRSPNNGKSGVPRREVGKSVDRPQDQSSRSRTCNATTGENKSSHCPQEKSLNECTTHNVTASADRSIDCPQEKSYKDYRTQNVGAGANHFVHDSEDQSSTDFRTDADSKRIWLKNSEHLCQSHTQLERVNKLQKQVEVAKGLDNRKKIICDTASRVSLSNETSHAPKEMSASLCSAPSTSVTVPVGGINVSAEPFEGSFSGVSTPSTSYRRNSTGILSSANQTNTKGTRHSLPIVPSTYIPHGRDEVHSSSSNPCPENLLKIKQEPLVRVILPSVKEEVALHRDEDGRILLHIVGVSRKMNTEGYVAVGGMYLTDDWHDEYQFISLKKSTSEARKEAELKAALLGIECIKSLYSNTDSLCIMVISSCTPLVQLMKTCKDVYPMLDRCLCAPLKCSHIPNRWNTSKELAATFPEDMPKLIIALKGIQVHWCKPDSMSGREQGIMMAYKNHVEDIVKTYKYQVDTEAETIRYGLKR